MMYKDFSNLERHLQQFESSEFLEKIGEDNIDWILDNHHLYNMNEIAHRCGISRKLLIRFFHSCGISTELLYSAEYTTPRAQGELAGRAREHGYIVDGMTIRRTPSHKFWQPNTMLEQQAVGVGYRVYDEKGQELIYKDINRPKYVATEYSNDVELANIPDTVPKPIYPTEKRKLLRIEKPSRPEPKARKKRNVVVEVIKTDKGLRKLLPEQCVKTTKKKRKGYIYFETYNKGRGVIGNRFVGEIQVNRKRFRFRSTNAINVNNWLDDMLRQYAEI